ncbi:sugar ABC transporter ATP-binding protein [Streptomyces sp. NPDC091377]|uniref:sugar ABC transporter ATP-binding protein n=1 Tax=Streptomyces sp. NPDC091377 TaxID=3365995 RepID=UPI00383A4582
MKSETILEIKNVSKSFAAVHALKSVSFGLRRGEMHAIAGENGAGKSTLMNIIDGILQPDSGEILLDGRRVDITSPAVAQKLGIGFVHQEIELCPDVTVAENMFMAATNSSRSFLMDTDTVERRAGDVLRQLGNIDPRALVRDLSISNQQLVEIAKALTLDCRVLILDEPTASLTEREAQALFGITRELTARGISIIYISHRLVEIFENCDRVSVLRDGEHIMTRDVAETTPSELVKSMVGRVLDRQYPHKQREEERAADVILSVHGLTERRRFRDVSFEVKQGEILGFAGLIGAGRSEIAKGICRLEGDVTGEVRLKGQRLDPRDYQDCIAHGILYLSEDRKGSGVFLNMSIAANSSAMSLRQVSRYGIISRRRERQLADRVGRELKIKFDQLDHDVSTLSGGNQQKVALAKLLAVNPQVIFLDEPTRGVDVGAKAEIYTILRDLARDGIGIVVISSELPELIGVCDRVIVVREGEVSGEVVGDAMTEENIMHLASIAERKQGAV